MLRANRGRSAASVAAAALLLLAGGLREPAEAAFDGLAFPAPAGSRWEIVAGYNTATHTDSDPYAIDLVRLDAPTEGTPLLSPLDGEVRYLADDCLSVEDEQVSVLLCHVLPDGSLERGQPVTRGERLGTVAPAGFANNNGLAHIHLAVHDSQDRFGDTFPLTGPQALEGRDLAPTTEANAYTGVEFTSTNSAPTLIADTGGDQPAGGPGGIVGGAIPESGIGLIVFGGGSTEDLLAASGCTAPTASFWATDGGRFVVYLPAAEVPLVNAEWEALFASGIPAGTPLLARCS